VKGRRTRARRGAFHRHDNGREQEEYDDQKIDFLRAVAFRTPIGIEIVFIQTHSFSTMET